MRRTEPIDSVHPTSVRLAPRLVPPHIHLVDPRLPCYPVLAQRRGMRAIRRSLWLAPLFVSTRSVGRCGIRGRVHAADEGQFHVDLQASRCARCTR